jgi:cytochrome c
MRTPQKTISIVVTLASLAFVSHAYAEDATTSPVIAQPTTDVAILSDADGRALLKKNNCLACHTIEKKAFGPAYKEIAAKYRGQADAESKLIAKVTKGGAGSWGTVPMPAMHAKAEDIQSMVKFVLSLN